LLLSTYLTSCAEDGSRGDPGADKTKAAACIACHGADGNPADPNLPALAGQEWHYLVDAMKAYQDGRRSDPTMTHLLETLTEGDLEDIAAFYASQQAK
jgi:cytochrome c553